MCNFRFLFFVSCTVCIVLLTNATDDITELNHTEQVISNNVDQLLYEMKQFGHEYNVQVQNEKVKEEKSQESLAHHLAILRADHTILAEQQRSILQLIEKLVKQSADSKQAAAAAAAATVDRVNKSAVRLRRVHRRSHLNSPSYHLHKVCRMLIEPDLDVQ